MEPDNRKRVASDEKISAKQPNKKSTRKTYYDARSDKINAARRSAYYDHSDEINAARRNVHDAKPEEVKIATKAARRTTYNPEKRSAKHAAKKTQVSKLILSSFQSNSCCLTVHCYIEFI